MRFKDLLGVKIDIQEKPVEAKEDSTIKQCRRKMEAAERSLKEAGEFYSNLSSRLDSLQGEFPKIREQVVSAEAARREAVELAVLDKIAREELEMTKEHLDKARRAEADAQELITAVNGAQGRAYEKNNRLREEFHKSIKAFWRAVFESLKADIRDTISKKTELAWGAASLAEGTDRFDTTVHWVFGNIQPPHVDINAVREELKKTYLLKDKA